MPLDIRGRREGQPRVPIFNVPALLTAMLGALVVVHLGRQLLSETWDEDLVIALAFDPARFWGAPTNFPGPPGSAWTSLATHMLLHGNFTHLLVNGSWLLAVGAPLARRMSPLSFIFFFVLCGVAGAFAYAVVHPTLDAPLIGASGAISGLMAAVFRLMFAVEDAEGWQLLSHHPEAAPRLSLAETVTNGRALVAIASWIGVNLLLALGVGSFGAPGEIAWEAHLGGFVAGLLAFGLFDTRVRR